MIAYQGTESITHPLGRVYARRTLDHLVTLATRVADDIVARPRLYRECPVSTVKTLSAFRSLTGHHPDWPDPTQRDELTANVLLPLLEPLGNLRAAAWRQLETGHSRQGFLDEVLLIRSLIASSEGSTIDYIDSVTDRLFGAAATVLASGDISKVFGVTEPIPAGWPLAGALDPNGAYLCELLNTELGQPRTKLSQAKFLLMQRLAQLGSRTLAGIMDTSEGWEDEDRLDVLAGSAAAWSASLGQLRMRIDVPRAWKDTRYRRSLVTAERDALPENPAGTIAAYSLRSTFGLFAGGHMLALQTDGGCSTGDIGCSTFYICSTGDASCSLTSGFTCGIPDVMECA